MFMECEKHNNKSGSDPKECQYYDRLSVIFGKRPRITSVSWGFDSGQEGTSHQSTGTAVPSTSETDVDSPQEKPKKKFPPKYRSGKNTSSSALLKELIDKEDQEAKAYREWMQEQLKQQEERDEKLLTGIMATMTSGLENIARILVQSASQTQQQFVVPAPMAGNPWQYTAPPNATVAVPVSSFPSPATVSSQDAVPSPATVPSPSSAQPVAATICHTASVPVSRPASVPASRSASEPVPVSRPASEPSPASLPKSSNLNSVPRSPQPQNVSAYAPGSKTVVLRQVDGRFVLSSPINPNCK